MNCDLVRSLDADLTWNLINTDKLNSSTRRAKTIFKARDAVPLNQQWAIFLEFELNFDTTIISNVFKFGGTCITRMKSRLDL